MRKTTFLVSDTDADQRIDKYLKKVLVNAPASFIYRLLRTKDVRVNHKKISENYVLGLGDEITVYLTDDQADEFLVPYEFNIVKPTFTVIYEDDNILVVNKPARLLVHPSNEEKVKTLTNMVLTYLHDKGEFSPEERGYIPSPIARIDRETSGVVVFAKKLFVHQALATAFTSADGAIRVYRLVVYGILQKEQGTLAFSLDKNNGMVVVGDDGKKAVTTYQVLQRSDHKTYVEARLLTGRQHQIRVSFAALGHPVVGDKKYGRKDDEHLLALNAYSLTFHGLLGPLQYLNNKTFIADPTNDLKQMLGE